MIIASVALCDCKLWSLVTNKLSQSKNNEKLISFLRHLFLIFAIVILFLSHKDAIMANLEDLREFWDPDTVDLMEWIVQNTPKTAAFAGKEFEVLPRLFLVVVYYCRQSIRANGGILKL